MACHVAVMWMPAQPSSLPLPLPTPFLSAHLDAKIEADSKSLSNISGKTDEPAAARRSTIATNCICSARRVYCLCLDITLNITTCIINIINNNSSSSNSNNSSSSNYNNSRGSSSRRSTRLSFAWYHLDLRRMKCRKERGRRQAGRWGW